MSTLTESKTIGDVVKQELPTRASRADVLVDQNQTLVIGSVCRTGAAGRKVVLGAAVNEVQTIGLTGSLSGGTFTFTFQIEGGAFVTTDPIAYNGDTAAVQAGIDTALGGNQCVASGTAITGMILTFSGVGYAGKEQARIVVKTQGLTGQAAITVTETTKGGYGSGGGADEVQTLAMAGTITGGTYTITVVDETGADATTTDLAYNADIAAINAALDVALGASEVVASGTVVTACVFTFSGSSYDKRNQLPITVDMSSLTGGGTEYTMTETTKGGSAGSPEADCICLEAKTIASVLTTKALFIVGGAVVDLDQLDFNLGNKVDAIAQLARIGIRARKEAPAEAETQV